MASRSSQSPQISNRNNQDPSFFHPPPIPSKPTLADWFLHGGKATKKELTNKKDQVEDEEGIAVDEISAEVSSISIPFTPQSIGNELAVVQSISLPSSPSKAVVKVNRSLDDLRAAIQHMKANSGFDDSVDLDVEPSYNHLPMEFRDDDGFYLHNPSNELSSPKGMLSTFNSSSSYVGRRLMKTHGVSNAPHAPDICGYYPVTPNDQRNTTFSKVKPPYLNLPPPQQTSVITQASRQNLMDNKNTNPPSFLNSNQSKPSASHILPFHSSSEFPPLRGGHFETECQPPIPTEPSSSNTKPASPWNQLFGSNRVKANGESLTFIPNLTQATHPVGILLVL